jgi:hypothetical protein
MRTSIIIACLIIYGFHNSVEAQSPLPLKANPTISEITLDTGSDNMIGALFLLKDSSILVSNSLVKEDYTNGNYEVAELYIDDINLISSERLGGPVSGTFLGAAVGFSAGFLTGFAIGVTQGDGFFSPGGAALMMGAMGTGIGAITGALVGSIKIKIPINGSMENYNRNKKKLGRHTVKYNGSPKY